jgi:hypothetical protein
MARILDLGLGLAPLRVRARSEIPHEGMSCVRRFLISILFYTGDRFVQYELH